MSIKYACLDDNVRSLVTAETHGVRGYDLLLKRGKAPSPPDERIKPFNQLKPARHSPPSNITSEKKDVCLIGTFKDVAV